MPRTLFAALVAMAYGRPFVVLDLDGSGARPSLGQTGIVVGVADDVDAVADLLAPSNQAAGRPDLTPLHGELDRRFDRIARIAVEARTRRGAERSKDGFEVEADVAALRTANEVLTRRAAIDRVRYAEIVAEGRARIADLEGQLRSIRSKRLYQMYKRAQRWLKRTR